jgi:hypothetical protein
VSGSYPKITISPDLNLPDPALLRPFVFPAPFLGAVAFACEGYLPALVIGDGVQDGGVDREGIGEPGDHQELKDPAGP